jgi:hypothetical protein
MPVARAAAPAFLPRPGASAGSRAQLPLDLVEPLRVRLEDSPAEMVIEQEVLRAAGYRRRSCLGGVELGGDRGDLLAQPQQTLQDTGLADEIGREQADDGSL